MMWKARFNALPKTHPEMACISPSLCTQNARFDAARFEMLKPETPPPGCRQTFGGTASITGNGSAGVALVFQALV